MRYLLLGILLIAALPSCSKRPYVSQWEKPDSALEPVGFSERKQEALARASACKFKKGEKVTLRNAKTMVFDQNPEIRFSAVGTVRSGDTATVLEPAGLFVKVEFPGGDRGFINTSDIADPVETLSADSFGLLPVGTNVVMPPMFIADEEMPAFLKAAESLPSSSLEASGSVLPNVSSKPQSDEGSSAPNKPAAASAQVILTGQKSNQLPTFKDIADKAKAAAASAKFPLKQPSASKDELPPSSTDKPAK